MSDEATRITQKPAREGEWAAEMRAQLEDMRGQVDAAVARAERAEALYEDAKRYQRAAEDHYNRLRSLLESDEGREAVMLGIQPITGGGPQWLRQVAEAALDAILAAAGSDDGA